jgi:hypothetical protein
MDYTIYHVLHQELLKQIARQTAGTAVKNFVII